MTRDYLLDEARKLKQPSAAAALEFASKAEEIAAELIRQLRARPDLENLIGRGHAFMMENHNRNFTHFFASIFCHYEPELLEERAIWAVSAYSAYGFQPSYEPVQLEICVEVLRKELSPESFIEVYPFIDWLIVNFPIIRNLTHGAVTLLRLQSSALEAAANAIVITDSTGTIEWANAAFTRFSGYTVPEVVGKNPAFLKSGKHGRSFYRKLWNTILAGHVWRGEIVNRRKDGSLYTEEMTITPIKESHGGVTHFIAVKQDITARKQTEEELRQFEIQLRLAHKMESIGSLSAGIAHEINTPVQFVLNNVVFLRDGFSSLRRMHQHYHDLVWALEEGPVKQKLIADIEDAGEKTNIDYFMTEIPLAIQQSQDGIGRVAKIVRAMKEFSHPGSEKPAPADLNQAISSTLTVCRSEWKRIAEVVTHFDPHLPLVPCFVSEINQAVLNIVVNACHAIADLAGTRNEGIVVPGKTDAIASHIPDNSGSMGTITVTTRQDGNWAEVSIEDTGAGIPEYVRENIFDPFFTTKDVNKGTGLGLSIAHAIIVNKHGGTIRFDTEMGRGTAFIFRLPLNSAETPN